MNLIINFVGFQIGWFATVMGGANNMAWAGTLAALVIVALHLWRTKNRQNEALLIVIAAAIGTVWESSLVALGITWYPSGTLINGAAPHWIIAMWMLFATTINVSMRWMRGRWWLAAMAGAVSGPLAFYAGYRLDGVLFPNFWLAMLVLAIGWAIFLPLLIIISEHLDGRASLTRAAPAVH